MVVTFPQTVTESGLKAEQLSHVLLIKKNQLSKKKIIDAPHIENEVVKLINFLNCGLCPLLTVFVCYCCCSSADVPDRTNIK